MPPPWDLPDCLGLLHWQVGLLPLTPPGMLLLILLNPAKGICLSSPPAPLLSLGCSQQGRGLGAHHLHQFPSPQLSLFVIAHSGASQLPIKDFYL